MTVGQLIEELQKLDRDAKVVAPFSPNPSEINVEEVGGVISRENGPYNGAAELGRKYSSGIHSPHSYQSPKNQKASAEEAVSESQLAEIRTADSDAAV